MDNELKWFVVMKVKKSFKNLDELNIITSDLWEKDEVIDFYYNAPQEDWDKKWVEKYKEDCRMYYWMFFIFQIYYILTILFVLLNELNWIILLIPPVWLLAIPLLTLHPRRLKGQYDGYAEKYLMKWNIYNYIKKSWFETEI